MNAANWNYYLRYYNVPAKEVTFLGKELLLNSLDFTLHLPADKFMLEGLTLAVKLKNEAGAEFYRKDNDLCVRIGAIQVCVQTAEELFILDEVYAQSTYGFVFQEASVVLDVGFNVGFASLFFAQQPHVHAVYGYEPFVPTYNQGLKNIALNRVSGKITAFNYGLSDSDALLDADYSYEVKGQTSVTGTAVRYAHLPYSREQVVLKDAGGVPERIAEANAGKALVAKIDCEGSEYTILKRWSDTGQMPYFKSLMIEWHAGLGPQITDLLVKNQFQVFAAKNGLHTGLIYALR
jgi:FkbM family methyltransferase